MDTLTETQLFNFIAYNNKIIEASLLLNYGGKATHFLSKRKSYIIDEGIDGQLTKWSKDEFITHYKNSQWIISQTV